MGTLLHGRGRLTPRRRPCCDRGKKDLRRSVWRITVLLVRSRSSGSFFASSAVRSARRSAESGGSDAAADSAAATRMMNEKGKKG